MKILPFPRSILSAIGAILVASLVCTLVIGAIFAEVKLLGGTCTESSPIEYAQTALLAAISGSLFVCAVRRPDLRGGLVLVAGFFLCLLIRENDDLFDRIRHGFWYPVALCAAFACLVLAWRNRATLLAGLDALCAPRAVAYLAVGLGLLLIFSRLFGSKHLWLAIYAEDTVRTIKSVAEESLELLADAFLALWAVLVLRSLPPRPSSST